MTHVRKHIRKTAKNKPVQMINLNSHTFYVLPFDVSGGGVGAIYAGKKPPDVGSFYTLRGNNAIRHVEIKWSKKISDGVFRLGLQYISFDD